jgi:predicted transcriptional regulator
VTEKQTAMQIIDQLPETASFIDIMYELYFRNAVEEGLRDIEAGRMVSHEEVMKSVKRWLPSSGQ